MSKHAAFPFSLPQAGLAPIWTHLFRVLFFAFCLSLAQPFAALAQTNQPGQLPPVAQEFMEKGIIAAQQQEYLLAIRLFQDARKIAPAAPILFFNLGLAESKIAGRELRAMTWFGAYLAASPDAANAGAVKEQITVLDVKNQVNLSRLIRTAEDAAKQFDEARVFPRYTSLGAVAALWAKSGDLETAFQIADSMPDASLKGATLKTIATAQAEAGDIADAQKTTGSIQDAWQKIRAQGAIARVQAKAGDIAGAQKTTDGIKDDGSDKSAALYTIVEAQARAGDIAAAQKTINRIQSDFYKGRAQAAIAEAQAKTNQSTGVVPVANAAPTAPLSPTVDEWIRQNGTWLLNAAVFLDLGAHLKSLPSDKPQEIFDGLHDATRKITDARQVITQMLKQQAVR